MKSLSHLFGGHNSTASARRRPARLSVEALEDRTMPASVSVLPITSDVNNTTTFHTLESAITAARTNGTVTIEPGAIADTNVDVTQNGLTIQGDPNVPSSILPGYNISIDANNVTMKNLNINFVSVDPGFSGLTVAHSTVNSIFISGGSSGNGGNVITQNYITSDVTIIGNTDLGVASNDQITNNTFATFNDSAISVTADNGAVIKGNTINGGGAISSDSTGKSILNAPQTGIEIDGGVNVIVANNTIDLNGQNGTPAGTTGSFTGIAVKPFDPATAGLPASTAVAAPVAQILGNAIQTGKGIGLDIMAQKGETGDRDTQVLVQGNDFHNNLIGVRYTGNNGSSITTDLGGGTLGSLGGNDFRDYTSKGTSSGAIVLQGVAGNAVLTAQHNSFLNTVTPANVVFAAAGSIDVSNALNKDQAFVQALYINFLGRVGTISELNNWVSTLNASSTGRADVIQGITQSTEALDLIIDSYYLQYLGRQADTDGQNYWVGLIQGGASLESIQAGFISSAEFISSNNSDYIQGLYRTFLGRTGTSAELAYWYGQLPSLGLQGVALGFASSAENQKDFITSVFKNYMHRAPTSTDLSFWTSQSGGLASIEEQILATNEFYNNG